MEWLSGLAAPLLAGIALGIAINAWSRASHMEKRLDEQESRASYATELPRGVAHVLNYQHLWPSQFEKAVRYVAQEEIARMLPKPETKPMPVVIVTKED